MERYLITLFFLVFRLTQIVASYENLELPTPSGVGTSVSSIYSLPTDLGSSKYDVSLTTSGSLIYRIFLGASSQTSKQTWTPEAFSVTQSVPALSPLDSSMDPSSDTTPSTSLSFPIASLTNDPPSMLLFPIVTHTAGDASSSATPDLEESLGRPSTSAATMSLISPGSATSGSSYDNPTVSLDVVTTPGTPTPGSLYDPRTTQFGIFRRRANLKQAQRVFEAPITRMVNAKATQTVVTLAVPSGTGVWVVRLTYTKAAPPSQQPGPITTVHEFRRDQTQTICFNQTTALATIAVPPNIAGVWVSALTLSEAASGKHCPGNYPAGIHACMAQYTKPLTHDFSANYTITIPATKLGKRHDGPNQFASTSVVKTSWTVTTSGPHWGTSVAKLGAKTGECHDEETCRKRCEAEQKKVLRLLFLLLPIIILSLLAILPIISCTRAYKQRRRNNPETSNDTAAPIEQMPRRAGTVLDGSHTCETSSPPVGMPDSSGLGPHAKSASRLPFSRKRADKETVETSGTVSPPPVPDSPAISANQHPVDTKILSGPETYDLDASNSTRSLQAPLTAEAPSIVIEAEPHRHSHSLKDALGALRDKFHGGPERESSTGHASSKHLESRASAATFPRTGTGAGTTARVRVSSEYVDHPTSVRCNDNVADQKPVKPDAAGHMRAVPGPSRYSPRGSRRGRTSGERAGQGVEGGVRHVTGVESLHVERGRPRRRTEASGSLDE